MFEQIVNAANDVVLVARMDENHQGFRIVYVNDAFCRLFEFTRDEVLGQSPRMLNGAKTSEATIGEISAAVHGGNSIRRRLLNYSKSGNAVWLEVNIVPLTTAAGEGLRFAAIERDITAEVERERELEALAFTDPLTKLPNRRYCDEVIERELSRAARTQTSLSLAIMDIDRFKAVNDAWGHPTGDRVLVSVADAIRDSTRKYDHVARFGGEEFVVVMPETDQTAAFTTIERMRAAIASRYVEVGDKMIRVTCSGGIAWRLGPTETADSIKHRADRALYAAKDAGRDQVCGFDGQTVIRPHKVSLEF
jgi:diguanylate cyclase (GGDEF)-like protein/PAS domain S-box-containing protein